MNEFSPGVLGTNDLGPLLELVHGNAGDRARLRRAIRAGHERLAATPSEDQGLNRANNVLIGMSQCGLFDLAADRLTDYGEELRGLGRQERARAFARHILTDLHGLDLYDAVQVIRARGERVTDEAIRTELRATGFVVTENESNHGKLRMWMEPSGVVDRTWRFSEDELKILTGTTGTVYAEWLSLSRAQRALLLEARRRTTDTTEWLDLGTLKGACERSHGRSVFPEGRLRSAVIEPLVDGGWIQAEGKGPGRGGKAGRIRLLPKLLEVRIALPLDSQTTLPTELRGKLATPLADIIRDLDSPDTHTKGVALELLALRLVRDLSLAPVAFRLRSHETGGAEVDLIAQGVGLQYSRWLFQCKNTATVALSALAKEVGMAFMLQAHVVVLVTTGRFAGSVQAHARAVGLTSNLQVVLLDRGVLSRYAERGPEAVVDELRRQAEATLLLKASQVQRPATG